MRNLKKLNSFRDREWQRDVMPDVKRENLAGAFIIKLETTGAYACALADNGLGDPEWEHVSVSRQDRCLTWEEMCEIKDLFFFEDEEVMQIHPAKKNYVNIHPYCLHLWRPKTEKIPLPPIKLLF